MSFKNFALAPELLTALNEIGYTTPTPIQTQAIPAILHGNDVMALAQTGTGKTAAFILPMLHLLNSKDDTAKASRQIRALILTPTRELATQVAESVKNYGCNLSLRSEVVFGGVSITPQIRKIQRGTDIIIATPGRLLDLINQRVVSLSKVEFLVLDEADRMLDMGFINDVKKIIELLPKARQNMLFSATLSPEIQNLAKSLLRNHKLIEVAKRNIATDLVTQIVHPVDKKDKRALLSYLIGFKNWKQVLVFTRTKHTANKLCEQLIEDGLSAAALHGNKSQGARTKALEAFKTGKIRVLVATDIAARGIDIDQLPYVVNYELPNIPEDYVHRIGRTGRAGKSGHAVSLVCVEESGYLHDIEKLIKKTIAQSVVVGFEPERNLKSESGRSLRQRTPVSANRRTNTRAQTSGKERRSTPEATSSRKRSTRTGADKQRSNWNNDTKPKATREKSESWAKSSRTGADKQRSNWKNDTRLKAPREKSESWAKSSRTGADKQRSNWKNDTKPKTTRERSESWTKATRTGSDKQRSNWRNDTRPKVTRERSETWTKATRNGADKQRSNWKTETKGVRATDSRSRTQRATIEEKRSEWRTDTKSHTSRGAGSWTKPTRAATNKPSNNRKADTKPKSGRKPSNLGAKLKGNSSQSSFKTRGKSLSKGRKFND